MSDKIYKYVLGGVPGDVVIEVPAPAIFLDCAVQNNQIVVWMRASPEPDERLFKRSFELIMTGDWSPSEPSKYRGAMLLHAGSFVLHVWQILD